jgi:glycosyltransferase involved in cell wall biosynthesis
MSICSSSISVVIVSGKPKNLTLFSIPKNFEVYVSTIVGLGLARNWGWSFTNGDIMVQLDDDLILKPELWVFVKSIKRGEFALAKVGDNLSSRVFIIWRDDFWSIGGCDPQLKYVFEDGDFAIRAKCMGLKLRIVPNNLFTHVEHPRNRYKNLVAINWEYSRVFVKYKREVFYNLLGFFWHPFDWRIKLQDLTMKIPFVLYWIIRGTK